MDIEVIWETYISSRRFEEVNLKKEVSRYNCHLLPYWKGKSLEGLKFRDILDYRHHLEKKNLRPQSVKHCMSLLKRALNRAKQLEVHPFDIPHFEMPRINNERTRFLSDREVKQLLERLKCRSQLWYDICTFAIQTGMRAAEIFQLTTSAVNLGLRTITIFKSKTNKTRILHMNNITFAIVEKYYAMQMQYLFSDKLIKQPSKIYRETVEDLKLNANSEHQDRVVFHTLRHTFASQLMLKGVPIEQVSKLLGHSSLSMTMRYAHLSPHSGVTAMNLLSDLCLT